MYGKIFESIFDSTLSADGGWLPTYIFMSMIVLADKDGIVDIAPKALYRRLGFRDYDSKITNDEFDAAVKYLERIDTESRSPDMCGRRIIRTSLVDELDGNRGWLIVNYGRYREKGGREDKAESSAERVRRFRERQNNSNKNKDVTLCNALKRENAHTDTDTDTDTDIEPLAQKTDGFDEFWNAYPKKRDKGKALKAWKKISPDIRQHLLADIENRVANDYDWIKDDGKYVPYPTTYLNGERWNDELSAPKRELTYAEKLKRDIDTMEGRNVTN